MLVHLVHLATLSDAILCLQMPFQSTTFEAGLRRRHYHSELPTASQGLLQLYRSNAPEDLGPKAVSYGTIQLP